MEYTAAVITVSDKGYQGLRRDTAGPALEELLTRAGWQIVHTAIVPDEREMIERELQGCCDEKKVCLAVTTGGTGFSKRDITPEATRAVIERETPGIPEAMRAESLRITPRGCLSREAAGIRGETVIVNCPGSEKAARECLGCVLEALRHGVDVLRGWESECGNPHGGKEKDHG
jgi:molybdopterin adenylyltransferase